MVLRGIVAFVVLALLAFLSFFLAHETRQVWFDPGPALAEAAKYDSTITRDRFGVPHISGMRDADAAFGLAYAHAEDDFESIEKAVLGARGRLATVEGVSAAENDYVVELLGIGDTVERRYQSDLSEAARKLIEGYAAGLNLYAAEHQDELLPGFAPVRGQDVAALFMLRLTFSYGLDSQLRALLAGGSQKVEADLSQWRALSLAVAPTRSTDGATRLLINPQGPFGGAMSWYEARITSGEGWNMAGGLMPGSPMMLSGAGPISGWGVAPNRPDITDIYALEANPNDRFFYRFDGDWRRLDTGEARIVARIWGPIRVTLRREILRSIHGPVVRNASGLYAIHYAGQNDLKGIEAFFALNKAQGFAGFTAVMESGAIPGLSFVYADRTGRIAQFYNASFPERAPNYDWSRAVPGNISATLWNTYLSPATAPRTIAPGSGFVIAANASPFHATAEPYNPRPESFPPSQGIETSLNNRTQRAAALLPADTAISAADFKKHKFDACYTRDSDFAILVRGIAQRNYAGDPLLEEAGQILRRYNLCTDKNNRGAALALLTVTPLLRASALGEPLPDSTALLRRSADRLLSAFGRLDPMWGTINRLRRGTIDLPLSGGPDALRDIDVPIGLRRDGTFTAVSGDSLILISTWPRSGAWQIESVVPFGSSKVEGSRHYTDQAQLFAEDRLKSLPLTANALAAEATGSERPGKPEEETAVPPPAAGRR